MDPRRWGLAISTATRFLGRVAPEKSTSKRWILVIAALGVVFGDIGTSPLYAFEAALGSVGAIRPETVLGLASLVVWYLLLVVTFKYLFLVMRADYDGEGGIFALLALLRRAGLKNARDGFVAMAVLVGAALLYGDGTITPAISVLSAIEGMEAIHPGLQRYVVPVTVAILALLFLVQRLGAGRLGPVFGIVMLGWFLAIGVVGLSSVIETPSILAALNPVHALAYVRDNGAASLVVFGSVVLAVTGAEALYADLGHFGRIPIARAWHGIALPALALNYLGQAAFALRSPASATSPTLFFDVVPHDGLRTGLVILAAAATVIASQALISGVFSLTNQAIDLGYLPRFLVRHTSSYERGQIYMPAVNFLLGGVCILLVISFRTGNALANAYGLAVTGTMVITTFAFSLVVHRVWKRPAWQAVALGLVLLAIELPLFIACLPKVVAGGYVPLVIGLCVVTVMRMWRKGRRLIHLKLDALAIPPCELAARLAEPLVRRVPGTLVFSIRDATPENATSVALEYLRRTQVIGEQIVILCLQTRWDRALSTADNVEAIDHGHGVWVINALHGYRVEPDAPAILERAAQIAGGLHHDAATTFLVVSRILISETPGNGMSRWRRKLFNFLTRNTRLWPNYLNMPAEQISEFNWLLDT
jgi:KUP system potassium uptake protein